MARRGGAKDVPLIPRKLAAQSRKRRKPRAYSERSYRAGIQQLRELGLVRCTYSRARQPRRYRLDFDAETARDVWAEAHSRLPESCRDSAVILPLLPQEQTEPKPSEELALAENPAAIRGPTYNASRFTWKDSAALRAASELPPAAAPVATLTLPEPEPPSPPTPRTESPHRRAEPSRPRPHRKRKGGGLKFPEDASAKDAGELRALVREIARREEDGAIFAATNARLQRLGPDLLLRRYREALCSEIENPGAWLRRMLDRHGVGKMDSHNRPEPERPATPSVRVRIPPGTDDELVEAVRGELQRLEEPHETLRGLLEKHGHTPDGVTKALEALRMDRMNGDLGKQGAGERRGRE